MNLQFDSAADIAAQQQWVTDFCLQQLPDQLARLLPDYQGEPIAELTLDLGNIQLQDFRQDFPRRLLAELTRQFSALTADTDNNWQTRESMSSKPQDVPALTLQELWFFLTSGQRPERYGQAALLAREIRLLAEHSARSVAVLLRQYLWQESVQSRLSAVCSGELLLYLVALIKPVDQGLLASCLKPPSSDTTTHIEQGLALLSTALTQGEEHRLQNVPEAHSRLDHLLLENLDVASFLVWLFAKNDGDQPEAAILKPWLQHLPKDQLSYLKLVLLPQITGAEVMQKLVQRLPRAAVFALLASLFDVELWVLQQAYQQLDLLTSAPETSRYNDKPPPLSVSLLIKLSEMLASERWQWQDQQKYSELACLQGEASAFQRLTHYLNPGEGGQYDVAQFTDQFNRDLAQLCTYGKQWLRLHLLPLLKQPGTLDRLLQSATTDTLLDLLRVLAPQQIPRPVTNDSRQRDDASALVAVFRQLCLAGSGSAGSGSNSATDTPVNDEKTDLQLPACVATLSEIQQGGQQLIAQLRTLLQALDAKSDVKSDVSSDSNKTGGAAIEGAQLQALCQNAESALQHLQALSWPEAVPDAVSQKLQRSFQGILSYPRKVLSELLSTLSKSLSRQQLSLLYSQVARLIELINLLVTRIEHSNTSTGHVGWGAKTQALLVSIQGQAALRRSLQSGLLAWDQGISRVQQTLSASSKGQNISHQALLQQGLSQQGSSQQSGSPQGGSHQGLSQQSVSAQGLSQQSGSQPGAGQQISHNPADAFVANESVVAAGCVLLWPYLERFFDYVGYLEPKIPTSDKRMFAQDKARYGVQLLHYLVFGEVSEERQPLPLLNLLCGQPVTDLPLQGLTFNLQEQQQCQRLLQSFRRHWPLPEHIQQTDIQQPFLQRQGRLIERQNHWHVLPEHSLQDALLTTLPWSINNVKLAWMPTHLTVDWSIYD